MNTQELVTKYGAKVRDLLKEAGIATMPIDVERIAKHLELSVVRRPLEDEYSGFLAIKEKTIVVNSLHPRTRQRFTIAHEIGHFLLHGNEANLPVFIDRKVYFRHARERFDLTTQRREHDANHFAAELLMPQRMLADYVEANPLDDRDYSRELKALADEFDVSKQAMGFRLCDLGFVTPT